ncbi:MAG: U32 family peptidase [Lachnospiraceae bacterium]|nr:U32 family peptidase [Lachnospiraceae bacterium]
MPELLIPAGSLSVVKTAVRYGADAVYVGGEMFGLRAKAKNLSGSELAEAVAFCHENGRKLYVATNVIAHERSMEAFREFLKRIAEIRPDAVIIADPGAFSVAKEVLPKEVAIHISTQANNVNAETFRFWYGLGAERVVCGRELSLTEIKEIRRKIPRNAEIEAFVHGAMCISYSGRCLLSAFLTGREANLGACTHPCRWKYAVVEETRPGEYMPVEEDEEGTYLFNSRDLCMIDHIPELLEAGIDSFKVEGRMKTALYVAIVTRAYREAIDTCLRSEEEYRSILPRLHAEIKKSAAREYTTGFFFGRPGAEAQAYDAGPESRESIYLGTVSEVTPDDTVVFEQKNKFCVADTILLMKPDGRNVAAAVLSMTDVDGNPIDSCPHASSIVRMKLSEKAEIGDIMRMDRDQTEE